MDLQIRAISNNRSVKISIVDITEGLKEISSLQKLDKVATEAIGKTIINTSLISLSIKDGSKVVTNINGMGYLGSIIAEFDNNKFRGYVQNKTVDLTKIQESKDSLLSQSVGKNGFLQVSRYEKNLVEPYTSRVEIVSGEINLDFMYYLQKSDQINSLITSSVIFEDNNLKKACGIMIQMLPNFKNEDIDFIEEKLGTLSHLLDTLEKSTNYDALIKDIAEDAKILESKEIKFQCSCSLEKVLSSIKLLDKEELEKAIRDGEVIEVVCDFCTKQYNISPKEVEKLIE
ncbi:Hsp33 family molecular chaperone HslO [Spiroplasma turonicum]|uniref:Heat shock protein 33 n=1 Tax=Spiroplasma turonicum TaxID=216946 RepID=A0A0K1P521_9MOLU|nr:Hsp33 family molecular chaperone HslO [Spiroplasma turonicum]AKU79259.1 heat shock protein 33 [Spiroplasma turonicum]ALX70282.1 heat shock protein 33 [Spiroplasma turonicum]